MTSYDLHAKLNVASLSWGSLIPGSYLSYSTILNAYQYRLSLLWITRASGKAAWKSLACDTKKWAFMAQDTYYVDALNKKEEHDVKITALVVIYHWPCARRISHVCYSHIVYTLVKITTKFVNAVKGCVTQIAELSIWRHLPCTFHREPKCRHFGYFSLLQQYREQKIEKLTNC